MISYVCVFRILKGSFDVTIKLRHTCQNSLVYYDACVHWDADNLNLEKENWHMGGMI